MKPYYNVTIEFMPDMTNDPDAFRLHRKTRYKVAATRKAIKAVREFEKKLDSLPMPKEDGDDA